MTALLAPVLVLTLLPHPDAVTTSTPDWQCIFAHESASAGGYEAPDGGAWQFIDSTWEWVTGLPGPAEDYPPKLQDEAALALYRYDAARGDGFDAWSTKSVCQL